MIALLELILVIFLSPVLILGVFLAVLAEEIRATFNVPLLGVATSALVTSGFLWMHSEPDPSVPWNTLVEVIAQAHVLGVSVPVLVGIAGCATFGLSLFAGLDARRRTASN